MNGKGFTMSDNDRVQIRHDGVYIDNKRTNILQYRWIDDPLSIALALVALGIAGFKVGAMVAKSLKG